MSRNVILFGLAAMLAASHAFADSSPTEVQVNADPLTNGSQNLYMCNDQNGNPVLMTSCPDYEERIDDDVVYNPPHPPFPPGGDLDTNGNPVDEYGNVIVGGAQQRTVPQTEIITFQTAPIDGLDGQAPTFSLDGGPIGDGQSFGDEDRSGGGGDGGGVR